MIGFSRRSLVVRQVVPQIIAILVSSILTGCPAILTIYSTELSLINTVFCDIDISTVYINPTMVFVVATIKSFLFNLLR